MESAPPPMPPSYQSFEDANHLRMLSIAHYIIAAITGLFTCFTLIYIFLGGAILMGKMPMSSGPAGSSNPEDQFAGAMFLGFGIVGLLIGLSLALCLFLTGRWLAARKNHTFCFVIACIQCINMPLGTLLGVFTILVINRPSVRRLFLAGPAHNNFSHH